MKIVSWNHSNKEKISSIISSNNMKHTFFFIQNYFEANIVPDISIALYGIANCLNYEIGSCRYCISIENIGS